MTSWRNTERGRESECGKIVEICRRLRAYYGRVQPPEQWPVLDELIATVLSQNTSDANSSAAFEELRRSFPDWDAVRLAPAARIARAIRSGGLSLQKAPRIKAILRQIHEDRGEMSLDFLCDTPTPQAIEYLAKLPGVGPKTVACVLLFACRKPVLPVDTHVHRVCQRLGLIGPRVDAIKAHRNLTGLVPLRRVLEFHIQLIRHGRSLCRARNPKCAECPLLDLCRRVVTPADQSRSRGQRGGHNRENEGKPSAADHSAGPLRGGG
jgi:endonuclease III